MNQAPLNCVFLGLSVTSTWGNGHATTYRGLLKELSRRGHRVTFLERDVPWYSSNREFSSAPYCDIQLYSNLEELRARYAGLIRSSDVVVVGSYVPDGIEVGRWIVATAPNLTAFYDIDTPVTLAAVAAENCEYISGDLFRKYGLYLSFTGGPTLRYIEKQLGSPCAKPLYCSVDPALYYPESHRTQWSIGYLGTYAADRQPALENLLLEAARQNPDRNFVVAGPQYPTEVVWPRNVSRIDHLPASDHRVFYNSQELSLNLTRRDMIRAGYSPSVRLFEAAACGCPLLTDLWPGLDNFFRPDSEILPVRSPQDVTSYLQMPAEQRLKVAERARTRTLKFHTAEFRAKEFEAYVYESLERLSRSNKKSSVALKQSPTAALI